MKLVPIDAQAYAEQVLPLSAELWAGRRDYETYARQTTEIARCGYGRRYYRTIGCYEGKTLVSSFKRYIRTLHFGLHRLRAVGIGAVFTPPDLRGRGYASATLGMLLDAARAEAYDLAYLFSDIRPRFYEDLGFRELPSRSFTIRADTLAHRRIQVARIDEHDWSGVRRCFEISECARPWGFVRTPLVWEWVHLCLRHQPAQRDGERTNLAVRRGRALVAYVLGTRVASHDAYVLDELGFAGPEGAELLPSLLRSAAGDLRRIAGWLPPEFARGTFARASVRKRRDAIFMAAPLTRVGARWLEAALPAKAGDGVWSTDHI
jgi:GNAT superfamily N-acetyltransferase